MTFQFVIKYLSVFILQHPGGGELVTEFAGMDSTKAFDQAGHSGDAKKDLKKYKIGEIVNVSKSI